MSTSYTTNLKLGEPAVSDTGWGPVLNTNWTTLDGLGPVGALAVTTHEQPGSTLHVDVAAGKFVDQSGSVQTYAGVSNQAIAASSTKTLYLDGTASWALVVGTSYPATPHIRLATVVTGGSTITSITDDRQCFFVAGTIAEGVNWTFGTTTGTKIGTATSQKIGFWNTTPVTQPTAALQAAITDSTGSSASGTIPQVRNDSLDHAASDTNDGLHVIYGLLNAIRSALVSEGLIKGS
jgi:hypothetical protein